MNRKAKTANGRSDNTESHTPLIVGDTVKFGGRFGEVVKVFSDGRLWVRTEDGRTDIYQRRTVKLLSRTEHNNAE
jgi:hypothetical protein